MGNCTSGNKEDMIDKRNAPTDRPSKKPSEDSSLSKTIDIRKSFRSAKKRIEKPFKKGTTEKHEVETNSATAVVKLNDSKTVETHSEVITSNGSVTVETHSVEVSVQETSNTEVVTSDEISPVITKAEEIIADVVDTKEVVEVIEESSEKKEEKDDTTAENVSSKRHSISSDSAATVEADADTPDATITVETLGIEVEKEDDSQIYEALFNKYDKDGSGKLKKSEIRKLLKDEFKLIREEADMMSQLIDDDGSNDVSFEEFKAFMKEEDQVKLVQDNQSYKLLAEAERMFKQHDKDNSGKLDKEELGSLLKNELGIPEGQADAILIQFDTTSDGMVGFKEFVRFLPPTSYLID